MKANKTAEQKAILNKLASGKITKSEARESLSALLPVGMLAFLEQADGTYLGPNDAYPDENPTYRHFAGTGKEERVFQNREEVDGYISRKRLTHRVDPVVFFVRAKESNTKTETNEGQ